MEIGQLVSSFFKNKKSVNVNAFAGSRTTNSFFATGTNMQCNDEVAASAITVVGPTGGCSVVVNPPQDDPAAIPFPFPVAAGQIVTFSGIDHTKNVFITSGNEVPVLIHQ